MCLISFNQKDANPPWNGKVISTFFLKIRTLPFFFISKKDTRTESPDIIKGQYAHNLFFDDTNRIKIWIYPLVCLKRESFPFLLQLPMKPHYETIRDAEEEQHNSPNLNHSNREQINR